MLCYSGGFGAPHAVAHFDEDVMPWCDAVQLDRLPEYMAHRPPSVGGGRACGRYGGVLDGWIHT